MFYPRIQVLLNNNIDIRTHMFLATDWFEYLPNIFQDLGNPGHKGIEPILLINDIKIKTSIDNLTETCEFTISKKYLFDVGKNDAGQTYIQLHYTHGTLSQISSNGQDFNTNADNVSIEVTDDYYPSISLLDVIEINMGAFEPPLPPNPPSNDGTQIVMEKRFMGIVTAITVRDKDVLFQCEDNMGYLKILPTKDITWIGIKSLIEVLDLIKSTWNINFDYNITSRKTVIDYQFKDVTWTNVTPVDIFKYLNDIGLRCYFRRNVLFVGLKFWNATDTNYGRTFRFTDPWYIPTYDPTHSIELNGTNSVFDKKLDYKTITVDDLIVVTHITDPFINGSIIKDLKLTGYYNGTSYNWELSNTKTLDLKNNIYTTGDGLTMQNDNKTRMSHDVDHSSKVKEYNRPNLSVSNAKDCLKALYQSSPKIGYTGTFKTFAMPYVCKGDMLLCNFDARPEYINNSEPSESDYYLPIIWDSKKSTNGITKDGKVHNNDGSGDSMTTTNIPFNLYIADEVNIYYNSKDSIRQEIRIEKIPKTYYSEFNARRSTQQFKPENLMA